jgi:hypothetical protein
MTQEQASLKRSREEEEEQPQLSELDRRCLHYIKSQLLNPGREVTIEELEDDQYWYDQQKKMDKMLKLPPMKGRQQYDNPYLRYPFQLYPEVENVRPYLVGVTIPCGMFEPYDFTTKPMLFRDDARKFWQAGPTADVEFRALYILQRQEQAHENRAMLEMTFLRMDGLYSQKRENLYRIRHLQTLPEPELDACEADVYNYKLDMVELDSHLMRDDPLRYFPWHNPEEQEQEEPSEEEFYDPEPEEDDDADREDAIAALTRRLRETVRRAMLLESDIPAMAA